MRGADTLGSPTISVLTRSLNHRGRPFTTGDRTVYVPCYAWPSLGGVVRVVQFPLVGSAACWHVSAFVMVGVFLISSQERNLT